ncbi:CoA pyrophosphatase [Vibrio palustris]|uniref:Putative NUDIX hydrolase n=1 Tax=Vibrio palustris TaxID=1918946 RepID=A0A1R4B2P3_9VIBR|nr:CoA pyrophosphatase [Vibrio palustris]SJL83166.1 putative NUDIX hydrolase [Vibrio palustris]
MSPLSKNDFLNHFVLTPPAAYPTPRKPSLIPSGRDDVALRHAGVLIGLVERDTGLHVIFTRRAAHLRHHPGQVSFPGGRYEPSDRSLLETALRETTEEIGVPAQNMTVVGQLPPLATISHFQVTPFIAFIPDDYMPSIDPNEVAEVFEVPAHKIFNPMQLFSYTFISGNQAHKVHGMTHDHHLIWGVTAQIIHALQRQLALPHPS